MPKLLCLLVVACPAVAQTVEGTVVDSATGAGIPSAFVAILDASTGQTVYSAKVDGEGRFQIEGVKDGAYRTRSFAPDYRVNLPDPRPFQVVGGKATLAIRLSRRPKISGRVVDLAGEGVANARVLLSTPPYAGQLTSTTDAQGRWASYADTGISYLVSVIPPAGRKRPAPDPETGAERAWAQTYYPGVTTADAATPISVPPGVDIPNLEWKLLAAPTHTVRGALLQPDGTPAPDVAVDVGTDLDKPTAGGVSHSDGTFEFHVVDGRWWISAELDGVFGERPRVRQSIEVAGHAIEGLKLRASAPFSVHGQIKMEIPEGVPHPQPPGLSLCAEKGDCTPAQPDAAGNFLVDRVYPGLYTIAPQEPPRGYYLDAVRWGAAEASDEPVEISSGAVPVTLVYKTNGGILRGAVEECAFGGMLLVPASSTLPPPGRPHPEACQESPVGPAHYEFRDVRPGDYYVLALTGDGTSPWRFRAIPGGIDRLLNQASTVTIRAGEVTTADVRAVVPPQ